MATERIIEHIDYLRQKPEHIRQRIALGVASGIAGLVAVTWMTTMATSGTLALRSSAAVEDASGAGSDVSAAVSDSTSAFTSLMGAAGAAFNATSTEAALDIIESETRTSSTVRTESSANATDKTVIPF
ncbi:MAG: hypothetical protein V4644_03065 [Patescibacteria group bacterium]